MFILEPRHINNIIEKRDELRFDMDCYMNWEPNMEWPDI